MWSLTQILFLWVVHNALIRRCDAPDYDVLHDSAVRLREYVGTDPDAVTALVDPGVLWENDDHLRRLDSLTVTRSF